MRPSEPPLTGTRPPESAPAYETVWQKSVCLEHVTWILTNDSCKGIGVFTVHHRDW